MAETISSAELFNKKTDIVSSKELFGQNVLSSEELFGKKTVTTNDLKPAGVLPPSMPTDGPEIRPVPREQFKIYKKLESLPTQVSTAVKQKAIEEQRAKKFGTISMTEPSLFDSMVKGAKNIPQNVKDIVTETGSLIMNIGRFGFNFSKNFTEDLNDMFAKREFYDPEKKTWFPRTGKQFEPTTDLMAATILDWKSILSGKTPTEIEKTPIGQALQSEFPRAGRVMRQS